MINIQMLSTRFLDSECQLVSQSVVVIFSILSTIPKWVRLGEVNFKQDKRLVKLLSYDTRIQLQIKVDQIN